jgi:osmotically-inducible protein OsmY
MIDSKLPLESRVDTAISTNPYLTGRRLQSETRQGRVVLRGIVGTFFQKQMAQEAVRRIDGVTEIDNRLEVVWN